MNIGILILATNSYFVLGIKFIKRFLHFYTGNSNIVFYFVSDEDPRPYLPTNFPVKYIPQKHGSWREGTNSKFSNIISLENEDIDYIYYFDADTNVYQEFTEEWFLGDLVGGEHYGNQSWMKDKKPYDRNPMSKAYIPVNTDKPQIYYYGAFFGGKKISVINLCKILKSWQDEDKKIHYEPAVNDESYINRYFHYNPPKLVESINFPFSISDKSGIGETRNISLDVTHIKDDLAKYKDNLINISNGIVTVE